MLSRRKFLKSSVAVTSLVAINVSVPAYSSEKAPSDKLNLLVVGVHNRGAANYHPVLKENVVGICDIDTKYLDEAGKLAPNAKKFQDFRKALETLKDLDGIVVSTADHTHAPISVMAMKMGIHCYCEKPLAHDIREVRTMRNVAAEKNLVTQMGTQIHAENNYRRVVEMIQSGVIGTVHDVYIWCHGDWGGLPADAKRPTDTPTVPANIDWDCWLGPAQYRPYNPAYIPGIWRRWWAFGNSVMGDMGCHLFDLAFWALKLKDCKTVKAVNGPAVNAECCPLYLAVDYTFEADGDRPAVNLHWCNGNLNPDILKEKNIPVREKGLVFVGDKGQLFADYGSYALYPQENFKDYQAPTPWIPNSIGHHNEWLQAIRHNKPEECLCRFSYGGMITETVLLGTLAYRTGEELTWDPVALKTNSAVANELIATQYRDGWSL